MKLYIDFCQNLWQDKLVTALNDLPLNKIWFVKQKNIFYFRIKVLIQYFRLPILAWGENLNKQNNSTIKTLKQYTTSPKTLKYIKKGTQRFDLFYNKDNFKAKRDNNMAWYIERQTCK